MPGNRPVTQHLLEGSHALRSDQWINNLRNYIFAFLPAYDNVQDGGQKKAAIYEFCTESLFPDWLKLQETFIEKIQRAKTNPETKAFHLQREISAIQSEAIKLLEGFCNKVEEVFPGIFNSNTFMEVDGYKKQMIREMGLSCVPFFVFLMRGAIRAGTTPTNAKYLEVTKTQGFVIDLTSKANMIAKEIWLNAPGEREFPLFVPQEA